MGSSGSAEEDISDHEHESKPPREEERDDDQDVENAIPHQFEESESLIKRASKANYDSTLPKTRAEPNEDAFALSSILLWSFLLAILSLFLLLYLIKVLLGW